MEPACRLQLMAASLNTHGLTSDNALTFNKLYCVFLKAMDRVLQNIPSIPLNSFFG
ncbi:hypothetical protein LLB_3417 [Legionella longbeachae D-4968]|nr:hypothetical protein LLB_3417 [Legionella longbeachae D-4968]